jgi:Flp pilus assembly protein TadD
MTALEEARHLNADGWANLGHMEPNNVRARALLEEALAADPDNTGLLTGLGAVLSDAGLHAQAVAVLKRAVALGSQDRNTFFNLGVAVLNKGSADDPMPFFEEAGKYQASPETWEAYVDFQAH